MHWASKNSHRAIATPERTTAIAACTPSARVGKRDTAAAIFSGIPKTLKDISVTMASVPSEPTIKRVKSYPADNLRVSRPV